MSSVTPQQTTRLTPGQVQLHLAITTPERLSALAYFPDSRRLVAGSRSGAITIWNAENGKEEVKLLFNNLSARTGVFRLAVTRDGKTVICCIEEGNIKVLDIGSKKNREEMDAPGFVS